MVVWICSVICIFIVFIFADRLEPPMIDISNISSSFIDKSVKVQGKIIAIKKTPSVLILDIQDDTGSIKVIGFNDEESELNKGQLVEIFGNVMEYKGLLEIEAKKINLKWLRYY